jgi:drug/metabolite transporter (DMT)-like permease
MLDAIPITGGRPRRERLLGFAAFVAICAIWGTTFLAIRVGIETIPTLYLTGLRFTVAGVILLAVAALRGQPMPRRLAQWGHEAVTGILLFALANGAVVWAEHSITSGLAALLAATLPLWMALLERLLGRGNRLTPGRVAGLIAGFGGVAAVVSPALAAPRSETGLIVGVLAMQFYTVTWNLGTLRAKYRPSGLPSAVAPALQMLLGGGVTLAAGAATTPWQWSYLTPRSGAALAYLTLFGSVIAFSAYHYALRTVSPGRLTLFAYFQPAVAALAGALVLDEPITVRMLVGMLLILGGVTVARRSG